jgi:hypothetical protein
MSSAGNAPKLPEDWDQIGVGSVVLAEDDPDGWWESIVIGENGDAVTLKWAGLSHLRAAANRTRTASASPTALSKHDLGLGQTQPSGPRHSTHTKHESSP